MALVIEDGTVVAGANSYQTVTDIRAYATARGITLDLSDVVVERQALNAMTYLESLRWKGYPTQPDEPDAQPLAWPRTGVTFDTRIVGENTIPSQLKAGQCQLVIEQFNGVVFWTSSSSSSVTTADPFVKKEKVDVLETEYATPKETGATYLAVASMPAVDTLLRPLLKAFTPLLAYRI